MNTKLRRMLSLGNLGGDFKKIYDDVKAKRDILVFGLNTPQRAHVASSLDRFLLYVVKDGTYALKAEEALADFYEPGEIAYLPEKDDVLIYRKAFQTTSLTRRVAVLSQLAKGEIKCCITTAAALMQYVPVKENLLAATKVIKEGDDLDVYKLCDLLDIPDVIGFPLLFPIGVINSVFHGEPPSRLDICIFHIILEQEPEIKMQNRPDIDIS